MKAWRLEADEPPMATALALFLSAALTFAGFARDAEPTIQRAEFGGVSFAVEIVQMHIGDFNLRLSVDFIVAHDAKFQGANPHRRRVDDLPLGGVLPRGEISPLWQQRSLHGGDEERRGLFAASRAGRRGLMLETKVE
jgi:hypothetical protein